MENIEEVTTVDHNTPLRSVLWSTEFKRYKPRK